MMLLCLPCKLSVQCPAILEQLEAAQGSQQVQRQGKGFHPCSHTGGDPAECTGNSEDLPGFRMTLPELSDRYATGVAFVKEATCHLIPEHPPS